MLSMVTIKKQISGSASGGANRHHVKKKSSTSEVKNQNAVVLLFDAKRAVHAEFVPPGQTFNQDFYL